MELESKSDLIQILISHNINNSKVRSLIKKNTNTEFISYLIGLIKESKQEKKIIGLIN